MINPCPLAPEKQTLALKSWFPTGSLELSILVVLRF